MGLFDSIIESAKEKYGLSTEKAGGLLAALLAYIAEPANGGIGGFFDRFRGAGLGGLVDSWIGTGESAPLTDAQLNAALGNEAVDSIAAKAGVERGVAASALSGMLPQVVDAVSPDGEVPDNEGFLSRIGGFLSDWGGAIGGAVVGGVGAAAAMAGNAADNVGEAASATYNKGKNVVDSGINSVRNAGSSVNDDDGGGGILKWLLLLALLAIAIILGYMYCGDKPTIAPTTNSNANHNANRSANTNTAASVESSFSIKADNGKYTVTGVVPDEATKKKIVDALTAQYGAANVNFEGLKVDANAKPFANGWWDNFAKMLPNLKDWKTGSLAFAGNAITEAVGLPAAAMDQLRSLFSGWSMPSADGEEKPTETRELSEVVLPNGAKLQAYPGGIEDQLIKFIGSDYKTADEAELKDKWFNFDDLNFEVGTSKLSADSKRQLDNIVAILKAFPDVKIKIGGYTDRTGDDAANLKLSDSRAKAVQTALKDAGVGAQVPEAEGYGEKHATVDEGASDEARAVDRKTAIRLIK